MSEYSDEIDKIPLLSDEETEELIILMKNGSKEARGELIKHNLRMVKKIAYKYVYKINLPLDDLISIGSFGLIKAIDNFDTNVGVKLSTVAYPYIINTFKTYITTSKVKKRDYSKDVSMQEEIYRGKDGDGITREEIIEDKGPSLENLVYNTMRDEVIKNILRRLTKEERELLYLRYGVIDGVNHTLEEIAQMKNLSRERIRQKEEAALKKLRHPQITKQIKEFYE